MNYNPIKITINRIRGKYLFIFLSITFVAISIYLYTEYIKTKEELLQYKEDPSAIALKEKSGLLQKVGKLVQLPENEDPAIATVTNAFRLRGQSFFSRAENGDKVLIFPRSGRAILYRPQTNKIIEAAPVNITDLENSVENGQVNESTPSVMGSNEQHTDPQEPAKVAIYNGTQTIKGLAKHFSNELERVFSSDKLIISELANADEYFERTIVINITGKYNTLSTSLVSMLNAQEEKMPEGENIPDVDILVVLGKDYVKTYIEE